MTETTEVKEFRRRQMQGLGKPIDSWTQEGIRFVRVGGEVHQSAQWKTFEDFLFDYLKILMSPEWAEPQFARTQEFRHPLLQWYARLCEIQKQESTKSVNGIYNSPTTGAVQAYLSMAYNLYLCSHNNVLPVKMLTQLRNEKQFEGALYEAYVLASFLKSGFNITLEDEGDSTTSHCEFTAVHIETSRAFSVEAKATTLASSRSGRSEKPPRIRDKLFLALNKRADFERIIFIELNRAETRLNCELPEWTATVEADLKKAEEEFKIDGDPCAYVFVTNHSYMHELDSLSQPVFQLAAGFKISDFPPHRIGPCAMADLIAARKKHCEILLLLDGLNVFATIPSSFDHRTPEEIFGQTQRPQVGQLFWVPNEHGILVKAELVSGQVLEQDESAWCQFKTDTGYFFETFPLTKNEMQVYRRSPQTFFGVIQPLNKPITEPHECFDFVYNTYKNTSKTQLLDWMAEWGDSSDLKLLDQPALAKLYCERVATDMWMNGQQ